MSEYGKSKLRKSSPPGGRGRVALLLLFLFSAIPSTAVAQALWPSLLVALERGYRPGIEELPQLAAALADAPEEVLIAWDRQGRLLLHSVGDSHEVGVPRSRVRELEGSVVIHNHPRGLPPSARDLDTVLRYGLRRLYVVARIEGVVSLTEINQGEAMRQLRQGGVPDTYPSWRPVAATASAVVVEGPVVIAVQVAYSLLGAWL